MRNEALASLLVVAVLAGAGASYFVSEANPRTITVISTNTATTITTTTYTLPTFCSTPVNPTTSSGMADVYDILPGSLGTICVEYHFDSAGDWSFASPDYGPLYYNNRSSGFYGCSLGSSNATLHAICSTLKIASSVGEFSHGTDSNVSVAYTISAEKNATGIFWLWIGICDPIYVAIGAVPASVSGPTLSCIYITGEPSYETVTGVSSIVVSVVPRT